MGSRFQVRSCKEEVLACLNERFTTAQEIADRVGVSKHAVLGHLHAAEALGLVELKQGEWGEHFQWRLRVA